MPLPSNKFVIGKFGYPASSSSFQKRQANRSKIKVSLLVIATALIIGSGTFGFFYLKNADSRDAEKVARTYIADILKGDYAMAYAVSDITITQSQTVEQFSANLSGLYTPAPYKYQPQPLVKKENKLYFYQKVGNLPPTASGRTDGVFALTLIKDKTWRVSSVSVQ